VTKQSHDDRQARAAEEAEMWLETLERSLRPEESAGLRQWLKVSMHREAIVARCKLWHGPEILAVLRELIPVETFASRVERHYGRMVLAIFLAVSAMGFTTVIIAVSNRLPGSDAHGNPLRAETSYETPENLRKTLKLPDGGEIALNTSTHVLISYGPRARDVTLLRGEASFDVVQDSDRPFRVHVGGRRFLAQDEGARFNLHRVTNDNVELAVVRGQVTALESRRREPLTPAQLRARVTTGDHTFGATEGGILGPGWQSTWTMEAEELQRKVAWQSDTPALPAR
jgi:transmembrane sensor